MAFSGNAEFSFNSEKFQIPLPAKHEISFRDSPQIKVQIITHGQDLLKVNSLIKYKPLCLIELCRMVSIKDTQ